MDLTQGAITIYVGDVSESLAVQARQHDSRATLITPVRHHCLAPGVYYVSIGDLEDLSQFGTVLRQADHIVYCEPTQWSDSLRGNSRMKKWTEDYLEIFASDGSKTVSGFVIPDSGPVAQPRLVDHRQADAPQIWVAGCSISHGVGVDQTQRYGALLADHLGRQASFLTCPGSSVAWAADQILRSDIRQDDIVFWGLTSMNRFSYWNIERGSVGHCTPRNWPTEKRFLRHLIQEEFLASDHLIHDCVQSVRQVSNFCRKLGATLISATLLSGLERFIRDLPGFVPAAGTHGRNFGDMFIDVGTDDEHPGPKSHRYFADKMLAKLRQGD
jgi:hypothetical protein